MTNITQRMSDIIFEQVKAYFLNSSLESLSTDDHKEIFFYSRLSLILVANADFRLLIKVHCNESDVRTLAKEALQYVEQGRDDGLTDFIKELTNLLGGALKRTLEVSRIQIGLSLPLMIRGFDELFSEKIASTESSIFSFGRNGQKIVVQVQLDYLTDKAKGLLSQVDFSVGSDSSGGFEFL